MAAEQKKTPRGRIVGLNIIDSFCIVTCTNFLDGGGEHIV